MASSQFMGINTTPVPKFLEIPRDAWARVVSFAHALSKNPKNPTRKMPTAWDFWTAQNTTRVKYHEWAKP